MSLAEMLADEFDKLSDNDKKEVVDFASYLRHKREKEVESIMDETINENIEALRELSK